MEVICLEDEALLRLVDTIYEHIKEKEQIYANPWVTQEQAMKLLNIKSKTTMQALRDENKIVFTKPQPKIILYRHDSLLKYLEDKSNINIK